MTVIQKRELVGCGKEQQVLILLEDDYLCLNVRNRDVERVDIISSNRIFLARGNCDSETVIKLGDIREIKVLLGTVNKL